MTETKIFTRDEDWAAFIAAKNAGERCQMDEDMWHYWLEVLPPVYIFRDVELVDGSRVRANFGFAEGAEPICAFWRGTGGTYFCQMTKEVNRG